jgi:predicted dehydrogenase
LPQAEAGLTARFAADADGFPNTRFVESPLMSQQQGPNQQSPSTDQGRASGSANPSPGQQPGGGLNRRQFVGGVAATGIGLGLAGMPRPVWGQAGKDKQTVNIAFVGVGRQGKILLNNTFQHIKGVNIVAICDIHAAKRKYARLAREGYGHKDCQAYESVEELVAQAGDKIDGAFVAVPDIHHAHVTNTLLKAGVNVYCEKEMATNLSEAASMVKTARKTGKLLQIGHQRRSNPFYIHARSLMHKDKFAGQVTAIGGQWNQLKPLYPVPSKLMSDQYKVPQSVLREYGFQNMAEFYFWRWFKDLSGGPMADLGSHQVDVYNWFLKSVPNVISAVGGNQWARKDAKQRNAGYTPTQLDHTLVTYQYHDTPFGPVHGTYQVLLSSSKGGFYETFYGDAGSIQTAEIQSDAGMFKEKVAEELSWEDQAEKATSEDGEKKYKFNPLKSRKEKGEMDAEAMETQQEMKRVQKAAHLPHQDNFLEAIRGNEELNCPGEIGYETAVTALKSHEAAVTGKPIQLKESDYKI